MPKIFDEQISFRRGSDSGEDNSDSVQPIVPSEQVWDSADGRPIENLRARTEILRRALETSNYFADYDRDLLLRADGALTFSEPASGTFELALSTGSIWVYPALSPGRQSGGRAQGGRVFCANSAASGAWTDYSGTPALDDLRLVAHRQYTGQRGYYDTDNFTSTPSGRTLGANRIQVSLVADSGTAGGIGGITASVTGDPHTKVTITYGTAGTPTTLADLITFINNDRSSQGAYGVGDIFRASTTGSSTNQPTPFTNGVVQGAYDAEAHEVTSAQLAAFFAAVDGGGAHINRLNEGEGLAIGYALGPVERGVSAPKGGRRQSLWDLPTDRLGGRSQNTTPGSGWALFTTGREPEKIPGSIPIGKVLHGEFIFIDGTRLAVGETLFLGESRTTYLALAATTSGQDGASLVGYEGGAPWNADTVPPTDGTLPADDVSDTITRIATELTLTTTAQSGSRRVGGEAKAGNVSLGNEFGLSLTAGSLREQLVQLLHGLDGSSRIVGLNGRVSEWGHLMQGAQPLRKEFAASGMPSQGAEFLRAILHAATNLLSSTPGAVRDRVLTTLMPIVYNVSGTDNLTATESATVASSTVLTISSMTLTRFGNVMARLPIVLDTGASATVPLLYVNVTGTSGATDATDGIYVVHSVNTAAGTITLRTMAGGNPNFTGATGPIVVTFLASFEIGSDHRGTRLRWSHVGADAGTYDPAGNPAAVIAASSPDAPLIKTFTPNPTTNEGSLGMVMWANRIEWAGGRKTSNIPQTTDKNLLDGVETGVVVDATANHHHGGAYSSIQWRSSPNAYTTVSNMSTGSPWFFTSPADAPAGYVKTAVVVTFKCQVSADSGAGSSSAVGLILEFGASADLATYVTATAGSQMAKSAIGGSVLTFVGQLTIPLYFDATVNFPTGAVGFRARIQSGSVGVGTDLTLSTLQVQEVGYVLSRQ